MCRFIVLSISLLLCPGLFGQAVDADIRVYSFEDGISHRNVFHLSQDSSGLLWLATINGLNVFNGYEFRTHYTPVQSSQTINGAISELLLLPDDQLWMASANSLVKFGIGRDTIYRYRLKSGEPARRESLVPHNLCLGPDGRLWLTTYDEVTGQNRLVYFVDGRLYPVHDLPDSYTRRPMIRWGGHLYLGAAEDTLWRMDGEGRVEESFAFSQLGPKARIAGLQIKNERLWVLLSDGRVYSRQGANGAFQAHSLNRALPPRTQVSHFLITSDGDVWLAGLGQLWYYDAWTQSFTDYNEAIRRQVKNTCNYRQIFQDRTGVIWLASDFGAIKIIPNTRLFTQYLSGGNEYCHNIYCSTRGITEDADGRIYISYYNAIHVLDPRDESTRPLFPDYDFFNFPFGLAYHEGYLFTGNGIRIDLKSLAVDTLFRHPKADMGSVTVDSIGRPWIGYQQWLYRYDETNGRVIPYRDARGGWDSLAGNITYLEPTRRENGLWVSTLENGLYRVLPGQGRVLHYNAASNSPARLRNNRVNATYEDTDGRLWVATPDGLHRIDLATHDLRVFTTEDGLPNNFINGILSEGDSCLWVSTDNGLCRFNIQAGDCVNFFTADGLSSNEFNRMSFYKARDGRLFFGGLNGVNAFYPDQRFLRRERRRVEAPLLLTRFTYFDGYGDTLRTISWNSRQALPPVILTYRDRMFTIEFALMDYRRPSQNVYSYWLENYDSHWSEPSTVNSVRFTDLPPGNYRLRVRARAGRDAWNEQQLLIPISIQLPYYRTWWFWLIVALFLFAALVGLGRYRLYLSENRRRELEDLVRARTRELTEEKQKSEELLLNILPVEMADELKQNGVARARRHDTVTVMFSDFSGFTRISERLEPEELVAMIDLCFRAFDEIVEYHGLEKIKTVGDAYLCVGGIRGEADTQAVEVVKAALEIQEFMQAIALEKRLVNAPYFEARIGIHTGPVVAGIVGIKKFSYDIWGDTVNIASRMETRGQVGRVNLSADTYKLIREHFRCSLHGIYQEHNTSLEMYLVEEYVREHLAL